jgi:hypothetical protein
LHCLSGTMACDVAAKLDCGHKFHENCLVDWLDKKSNCPICRAQVHWSDFAYLSQPTEKEIIDDMIS